MKTALEAVLLVGEYIGASPKRSPDTVRTGMNIADLDGWQEIRVTWRDAYSPHSGWHEVAEYVPEDAVAVTMGRYWKDCQENYLTVVGTIFQTEDGEPKTVGDVNHIPVGMILEIEVIHGSKERPPTGPSWS